MKTFKTITKEEQIVDTVTCNGCGEVCSGSNIKAPTYDEIKIVGCYYSRLLSDLHIYSFELCETCVVKIMDGLKIPPTVTNDCYELEKIDYATDRKRQQDQIGRQIFRENMRKDAIARGVCSWVIGEEDSICGGAPEGMIDGVPTCAKCLIDDEHSPVDIARKDKLGILRHMGLKQRKEIGLNYLSQVREGKHPEVIGPHDFAIYISTAISMLLTDTLLAAAELYRLTNQEPSKQKEWIHSRIPTSFGGDDIRAKVANDWLAWARNAGYRNVAASVMLGNSPEEYWSYYDRS